MIKFIATDLDGTLLKGGAQYPGREALELIRELQDRGVLFAAASGRQCPNLRRSFWPVSREMVLIGENGCLVTYRDRVLSQTPMDRELALEIAREIMDTGGCDVLISCADAYYIMPRDYRCVETLLRRWRMTLCAVESPEEVVDPILKVSLCMAEGLDMALAARLAARWEGRCRAVPSGNEWLDFCHGDKGRGIRAVREEFGFAKDEVAVFGDYYNDLEMLDEAGCAYVMDTAPDDVKARGNRLCHRVEDTLRELLNSGMV